MTTSTTPAGTAPAPTLAPLPLLFRFAPVLHGITSPAHVTAYAASVAERAPDFAPLMALDGPALLAAMLADGGDPDRLFEAATSLSMACRSLANNAYALLVRVAALAQHLEVQRGEWLNAAGDPDPDHGTPETSALALAKIARDVWLNDAGPDPMRRRHDDGKWWRYVPEEATPHRVSHGGVSGWAVCLDPFKRERWGFVPDALAAGAPELVDVTGGAK